MCRGFLGNLFGGGKAAANKAKDKDKPAAPFLEDNLGEEKPELVLVETEQPDGASARIIYRSGGVIDAVSLERLCSKVGWPARPVSKVEAALKNSFLVASLHVEISRPGAPSKETLIGLARATSDHAFNATIWDVLVDPEYQGQVSLFFGGGGEQAKVVALALFWGVQRHVACH